MILHDQRHNVVLPCYNEASRLKKRPILEFLAAHPDWTATLVDDGSQDETLTALCELHRDAPEQVAVLRLVRNGGKAEAVRQGMQFALDNVQANLIGFADADLAAPLQELLPLAAAMQHDTRLIGAIGVRLPLWGHRIERKKIRQLLGKVFVRMARPVLGATCTDTQCGLKLFRAAPVLRAALSQPFCSRWIFDVELLKRLLTLHAQAAEEDMTAAKHSAAKVIFEHPLSQWTEVAGSRLKGRDFVTAAMDLVRIAQAATPELPGRFASDVEVEVVARPRIEPRHLRAA